MIREFIALVCFILASVILCSSGDPRIHTSHGKQEETHDGSRHPVSSDHKSHSRTNEEQTHDHKSGTWSKEKDSVLNFERVLFDREELKNYVLDYLRTHGFAQNPTTSPKKSLDHKQKSADRHSGHRDKLESPQSSFGGKREQNHHSAPGDEKYFSRNSESGNQNRAGGHSKRHKKSKSLGTRKRSHGRHGTREKENDALYKEKSAARSGLSSKERRGHHQKSIGKSYMYPGTKKERITNTDINQNNLNHVLRSDKHDNQRRKNKISKTEASSSSLEHRGHYKSRKSLNNRKSNKRDFIAILPAQSFKLEGFDVQPVHQSKLSQEKHKRKSDKMLKHVKSKKHKSEQHSDEEERVAKDKSGLNSKSPANKNDIKAQRHGAGLRSSVSYKRSRYSHRKQSESSAEAKRKDHLPQKHHSRENKKISARKRKKTSRHRDAQNKKYSPSWKSLDKRKIPSWYDDAKFGIFIHWGLYSVPSFGTMNSEWFWYKWKGRRQWQKYLNFTRKNHPSEFGYNEFAPYFTAEFFNATQWAELVARSGARYFVFTSKHHEGFTNWNSSVAWNWNSVDIGPHRNIVDELAKAFRNLCNPKVKFGLYYSLYEWFNPHYLRDKANGFKTDEYIKSVMNPQLYDLVNTFKPDYLWTDGEWEANDTYWKSTEFLAWLFNESPVKDKVVVNDRWGKGCRCRHGGVCTGADRYNPGKLQKRKWENAMTIDRLSWGFRRDANLNDYFSIEELIKELVSTVSCGGNLLMNVGPASDGTISPIFQERLTQMGDWLKVNGDAIYKTRPWRAQNDSVSGNVWYTAKGEHVFAISLSWPRSGKLELGDPIATPRTSVKMLGTKTSLSWIPKHKSKKAGLVIHVPVIPVSNLPCLWAWVFKLSHVK